MFFLYENGLIVHNFVDDDSIVLLIRIVKFEYFVEFQKKILKIDLKIYSNLEKNLNN